MERDWEWVTSEQREQLAAAAPLGTPWEQWLAQHWDESWPQWRDADQDTMSARIDEIIAGQVPEPASVDAGDVASLSWVSESQAALLAESDVVWGDWREWLPERLDGLWPQWRESSPEVIGPWLDQAIPGLLLPTEPEDPQVIAEKIVVPFLDAVYDGVPALALELGITEQEVIEQLDALPDDAFVEALEGAR